MEEEGTAASFRNHRHSVWHQGGRRFDARKVIKAESEAASDSQSPGSNKARTLSAQGSQDGTGRSYGN